ncbi:MAG: VOC family protein, partial [Eubacteriales bacterium]|nr:VOC family protein [Eubacteriales bacterium]
VILHCELDLYGQVLALSERNDANAVHSRQTITGNTMQFCLHFGEGNAACVEKAYDALKTDATVLVPLAPCAFSPLMAALIDPYGVSWCLFV